MNRLSGGDVSVNLIKAVAGIEDQIFRFGFDQDTNGIPGFCVIPAIGA